MLPPLQLGKADQAALSQVSRYTHAAVVETLWRDVIIRAEDENNLHRLAMPTWPQSSLRFTKELQFLSSFQLVTTSRCVHFKDYKEGLAHIDPDNASQVETHFHHLARVAKSLVEKFEYGQLQSFT